VIVDTSGAALHHVLNQASADRQTMPYGLKVNSSELSAVLDAPVNDLSRAAEAVRELRRRGITLPIVSLGAQGAMAASEEGVCHVVPPTLKIISTVGSGDSLLAGLVVGLLRGETLTEALRLGVACGSANALTIGGGLIDSVEVARIRHETRAHLV
jgi:fructose-1-phosphate kinase PfkB-like protein